MVNSQAEMVGFLNSFVFLVFVCAAAMPLVFLLKNVRHSD